MDSGYSMTDSSTDRDRIAAWLRRLDHLPAWAGLAVGGAVSLAAGAVVVLSLVPG